MTTIDERRAPEGCTEHERPRVLVVDDHALLADGLCLELSRAGFDASARSGPTAASIVEHARVRLPCVALVDLDLGPEVGNGADLVRHLVDAGVTVVVLSGSTDQLEHAACVAAGATGIINKAEGLDNVLDAVRRTVAGERLLPLPRREELLARLREHETAARQRQERFGQLTPRERDVLARLMRGEPAATIAKESFVSLATVRTQIRSILVKLGASSQLAAVAIAHEAGWRHCVGDDRADDLAVAG